MTPQMDAITLTAVGVVASSLIDIGAAPNRGDEGAPAAWLELDPSVRPALDGVTTGDELIVITWLDRADRDVLRVHPRGDESRPEQGVFSTRSPHRPNPLGLHRVRVIEIDDVRLHVSNLEAVDGTPIPRHQASSKLRPGPALNGDRNRTCRRCSAPLAASFGEC